MKVFFIFLFHQKDTSKGHIKTDAQGLDKTMVYFFTSNCGEYTIYMGKDKFENDELIKFGFHNCVPSINFLELPDDLCIGVVQARLLLENPQAD